MARLRTLHLDLSPATATLAILATSLAYAFAPVFARWLTDAGLAPVSVSFARFALTGVVLARFVDRRPEARAATWWAAASGVCMALGWIAHVHVIETVDVATAAVAYLTFPLFALAASAALTGRRPTGRAVVAGALVVVGAAVGLGGAPGGATPVVLIAPATMGFAIAVLTDRLGPLAPLARLAPVAGGASVGLLPLLVATPVDEVIPTGSTWFVVAGMGIVCSLVPMTIFGAVAPRLGAARAAVAGATELPWTFVTAALVLGETIRTTHLVAAAVILAAVALTPAGGTDPGTVASHAGLADDGSGDAVPLDDRGVLVG